MKNVKQLLNHEISITAPFRDWIIVILGTAILGWIFILGFLIGWCVAELQEYFNKDQ